MTDRELLEAAAKAAGMQRLSVHWNPLEDDGDALRLAVRLGLDLTKLQAGISWDDEDRYAATRRAIVRAAAAIGKDMT